MVTVREAADIIFANLHKPQKEAISIEQAVNRVLAESIFADRDFPPFDRVSMDGIAIRFSAWADGSGAFKIAFTQAAGDMQKRLDFPAQCAEVMTGAVLPENTDTVIRYEDLQIDDGVAKITIDKLEQGQNVHRKGIDCKSGEKLLEPGLQLSPAEIALLASVGKSSVEVYRMPKTAVISSGDELVAIDQTPGPQQIRRSNTYAIAAAMHPLQWNAQQFHFKDDQKELETSLRKVLQEHDVLILSGGVSKGKFDFIPEVFRTLGVKKLFHQVSQRPGKPFWFGVSPKGKTVFALPGNPVSTYMCFYRYIKPWIYKSMGMDYPTFEASLATDYFFKPPLTYFLQVAVKVENGKCIAYPEPGGGSGDFVNLKNVTGFVELPADRSAYKTGEVFSYYPIRHII